MSAFRMPATTTSYLELLPINESWIIIRRHSYQSFALRDTIYRGHSRGHSLTLDQYSIEAWGEGEPLIWWEHNIATIFANLAHYRIILIAARLPQLSQASRHAAKSPICF